MPEEKQNDGFETWSPAKKMSRKRGTAHKAVGNSMNPTCSQEGGIHRDRLRPKKNITGPKKQEGANARSQSGKTRKRRDKGSVLITEKEYRLLLSLKKKSKAASSQQNDCGCDNDETYCLQMHCSIGDRT